MDLEYARIPRNMEALNEKYWYHFQEEKFRTFLIQADVKNNENLSENYADNVMELVNSKVPGLFEKHVSGLCVDSEIFCGNRKISGILNYTVENEKVLKAGL